MPRRPVLRFNTIYRYPNVSCSTPGVFARPKIFAAAHLRQASHLRRPRSSPSWAHWENPRQKLRTRLLLTFRKRLPQFVVVRSIFKYWFGFSLLWYLYVGCRTYWTSNEVPITGRIRFSGLPSDNTQFDKYFGNGEVEIAKVLDRKVPPHTRFPANDPQVQRVYAVAKRLLWAAGLDEKEWQFYVLKDQGEYPSEHMLFLHQDYASLTDTRL